jgi:putative DNA methylase
MTNTPNRPPLFIEKIMPVQMLNQQVYYEHGGNPFKGLHRWYSRKPLSFSRASVLASLLPDSVSLEEFEYLLGLQQGKDIKLYKTPPSTELIQKVHDLCEEVWGTRTPTVLDAFGGGGSIPFEAARYGLNVLASDLNPVAVVTMKAAMEYPLKFGPDLQVDIDRWVKWVGDEAEKRLAEFFPALPGETVQNYLWAHTVVCPSCQSVIPLSPNWWIDKSPGAIKKGQMFAVKPIPNLAKKRVDFKLVKGKKGKGSTIITETGEEYDPDEFVTIGRGIGKCCNCSNVIENEVIMQSAKNKTMNHQLYAVAYKQGKSSLIFRVPEENDFDGFNKSLNFIQNNFQILQEKNILPIEEILPGQDLDEQIRIFCPTWKDMFNPRQLLTLVTYVEIINEAKILLQNEYEVEKFVAISTYLGLVLDRCVDKNARLSNYDPSRTNIARASAQHSLNLMWNYPENAGNKRLWQSCSTTVAGEYKELCELFGTKPHSVGLPGIEKYDPKTIQINLSSADSLYHIANNSVDAVVTDPPYYGTIQYAEMSDFFYVWMKRTLGDIFPELFYLELTDKDQEAVANPSRFRDMGETPDKLANQDYEAKMLNVFREYHRVLRDEGVMTVQFNHKDSGAWDTLAQSLIETGFQITASWAVSTESPQNLHQANKNSVASTVLLVCRKRDPDAGSAWWDDLRGELNEILLAPTMRKSEGVTKTQPNEKPAADADELVSRLKWLELRGITGIDLYLSAFGPALKVFSQKYPILDNSGNEVRPEEAFKAARKAVGDYRFTELTKGRDISNIDAITQWYLLAWDAFKAREFPFDDGRKLALAIGGNDIDQLKKEFKLIDATAGVCKILTPMQRFKKKADGVKISEENFVIKNVIDSLHSVMVLYQEDKNLQAVRRFMKATNLLENDPFMKTFEIALQVLPAKCEERDILTDLRLGMEEIQGKVNIAEQPVIPGMEKFTEQLGLDLDFGED